MPIGSGISGQLGLAAETTWGTAVTVTRFYELLSESVGYEIARIESDGIRADQRVIRSDDWTPGTKRVSGSVELELTTKNMALLFKHALGTAAAPTGSNPYTHVLTPGSLTGLGLTVQVGRPSSDGTVQPFTFNGCKVSGWELGFEIDQTTRLTLDLVGKDQTTGTALATASYTSSNDLLAFTHGAITIAGSSVKVKSGTVSGENPLDTDRIFLGDTTVSEPLENGRRNYSFDLTCEFESLTAMNRFVNGTEAALSLAFTRGSYSVTLAGNVRFDTGTPALGGMEILEQPLTGKFVATGADSTALTVTVVSAEATP
jgi:hypothetical protein